MGDSNRSVLSHWVERAKFLAEEVLRLKAEIVELRRKLAENSLCETAKKGV